MDNTTTVAVRDLGLNWFWMRDLFNQSKCAVKGFMKDCDETRYVKYDNHTCSCICYKKDNVQTLFWSYCGGEK